MIIGFIRWPKTQFIGVNMSVMCLQLLSAALKELV